MAKTRKRKPFPEYDRPTMPKTKESILADETLGGVFGFFRDFGTRETIESIIVAIVLALMFRAFEAEAFIIPTGSMAPSLQGQHKDLECENCGFRYRVGASQESESDGRRSTTRVRSTFCPICQYETLIKGSVADHTTNSGDRILVNKFVYDFKEPERYDVIVFKNPNNGKQNYIKRLIGLPGDNILIENGDIYLMTRKDNRWERKISRKPPYKLRNVLQTVDDTDYFDAKLAAVNWPLRWQEFTGGSHWQRIDLNGKLGYVTDKIDSRHWLRYRHFRPQKSDWKDYLEFNELPPRFRQPPLPVGGLISDHYAYNDMTLSDGNSLGDSRDHGFHWVGDIGFECWTDVESETGKLLLDVVEGGAHFTCEIDVATGVATLHCDDTDVKFQGEAETTIKTPTAKTSLKGSGKYHIEYVNADDRIHLWINNRLVSFDAAKYVRDEVAVPRYSPEDPGDAEPLGIAAENLAMKITRLKVVRDIYYTSHRGVARTLTLENETDEHDLRYILDLQQSPEQWSSPRAQRYFHMKKGQTGPMFELNTGQELGKTADQDQFLPMGDNSPQSLDGRVWDGPNYVERDMLIGRALFVYWPHTLNEPIKYFPNFGRMGFIR